MGENVFYKHDKNNPSPLNLCINARFKEDTTADLSILDAWYSRSLSKFSLIFSPTEASVYKILHYFKDNYKLQERNIKTIDGLALESYFDPFASHKYNMIHMKKIIEVGVLSDLSSRWLVVPNMASEWTPRLAYYFYNEIREAGCLGIIFHSDGKNNFGKIIIEQTSLNVLQFPEEVYDGRQKIEDDEW